MSEGKIAVSYVVNNSEFNSKISQMKMNLGLLQTEVKNSAKEINLYGDNLKTLGSKQSALNDAINQSKKIIDTYNTSIEKNKVSLANNQEQLTKLSSRKKEVNAQYKEAVKLYGEESSQAKSLKEQLDAVTEEYRNMNTRIATNKDNIVKHTAQMEKQRGTLLTLENDLKNVNKAIEDQSNKFLNASKRFSEASSTLEKVGSGMSDIGGKIAMLSSPLLLFGTYASNAGITFEKNMSQVSATAGLASDDVKYLSERAKQLGEDIRGANATDIAASYQYLALAGQSVGEMYQTIEPYTKAAIAYGEDQKRVTDLGTDSMSALRLETEKTSYYLNVLTKAQNKSNTTATQLMEAYIACGGTLANMNVPLEESATLLGRMADQGTKGSEAGNALNSILVNLMGTKSTTVLKTGLGLMSGISMSALVAGIAGVGTALGVGVYAWHEYNDVMDSTVTKAKEDYGLMERALASLNGITLKTKEELISSGDVYREWGDKVSEATTDTLETITTGVNDINLAIQGANFNGIIDDNELSAITEKVNTFCQNIISSIENNQDPAYEAMKNMFNIDGIIDEQEQAVLDSMKKGTTEAIQGIQERANRINEILTNAKNNNVGLTEEEYSEILRLEQEMGQALIDRLNLEAEEKLQAQQGFWDRYQVNTTEGLSNILKAEYEAKEKNIEAINEKYNAMIEAAEIGMSTLSGEELAFAQEKLQNVIKQRDAEINIEETLWQDKISMAENNYSSLMEKINKFNGEELTNQDMKKQKILKNLEEQYAGMSTITESGWYNIENTVTGKTTEMYVEVDKNTKEVIGVFNTMNGTVGGYSKEIANNVGSMAKEIQIKEDIIKNSINNASNVWVDASNNIMNKNGEIIGNLQEVSENADGTKSALMEIGNKKYSVDIDTSGAISKLDSLSMSVKNFVSNVGNKISNAIGSIGDFITGNRETGGSVLEAGLYNINEAGVELIDTPSNSRAINLGEVTRGELAYIPANSYVTNATMTTRKMSNMIDSKLSSSMSIYANNVNKAIIAAFKGIENEKNIIINMYNSNFVDKGSEDANKSYLRNIFNSAK